MLVLLNELLLLGKQLIILLNPYLFQLLDLFLQSG